MVGKGRVLENSSRVWDELRSLPLYFNEELVSTDDHIGLNRLGESTR
jgi:hypothetical protein